MTNETMELIEIVMKLVGQVRPTGEHETDQQRLENLKKLTQLVDQLLSEIYIAAQGADRVEASMKNIGVHARDFLTEVKNSW